MQPKSIYLVPLILSIIIAHVTNAQNNNIVYQTVHEKSLSTTGKTIGFELENLYAFATPYLKSFSLKTRGLVDFEIKTKIKEHTFTLPFLDSSKKYIFGVFHDKNNNGLLDLSNEKFYFSYHQAGQLIVDKANNRTISLEVLDTDDSKDIGVRVFDSESRLLFTRQYSNSKISLENLPKKSKIKLYSTSGMEDHPIAITEEGIHYDISRYPQKKFIVEYGTPWSPLDLNILYKSSKYYLTLTSNSDSKVVTLDNFHMYDMPHDSYTISMHNKTTKEKVLDAPSFDHPTNQTLNFEFSKNYFVQFNKNVVQRKCRIYKGDQLLYQGGNPSKLELMQSGDYIVELFDKPKRSIRKKNKELLKNFEQFQFKLHHNSSSTEIFSLIPKHKDTNLTIKLYNSNTLTPQEGQIIFLQKKEEDPFSNLIHFQKITDADETGLIHTNITADSNQLLYLHFDFNSNFVIDKTEEEYVRGFRWSDLKNTLSLPQVKTGYLELSAKISKPNLHFVTVKNTIDDSTLVSNYITKDPVSYQNLPMEIDLRVIVTYDSNGDEVPDETDLVFPPVYTRIRANKVSQKLVLELNEK